MNDIRNYNQLTVLYTIRMPPEVQENVFSNITLNLYRIIVTACLEAEGILKFASSEDDTISYLEC